MDQSALAIGVIGTLAAILTIAIAAVVVGSRSRSSKHPVSGQLREDTKQASVPALAAPIAATPLARSLTTMGSPGARVDVEPRDPLLERTTLSAEEFGAVRRRFLNRSLLGLTAAFLASLAVSFLAFLWPKLRAGFGGQIVVGDLASLRNQVVQSDGTVVPLFIPAAQAYVVPFLGDPTDGQFGRSVASLVVGHTENAAGLMALWQRCVHLGCRVPQCLPSQGFECPCHGSRYNFHGEYEAGPAPRNLDRFVVEVSDNGELVVDTGSVVQTPRAKRTTIAYPQGPSCI